MADVKFLALSKEDSPLATKEVNAWRLHPSANQFICGEFPELGAWAFPQYIDKGKLVLWRPGHSLSVSDEQGYIEFFLVNPGLKKAALIKEAKANLREICLRQKSAVFTHGYIDATRQIAQDFWAEVMAKPAKDAQYTRLRNHPSTRHFICGKRLTMLKIASKD